MIGFLIFGWSEDEVDLGPVDPDDWGAYDMDEPCNLVLSYNYFHLFFLFGLVTSKTYLIVNEYDEAVELDSDDVEEELDLVPIPFMHRWGIGLLIGSIMLLSALGAVI